MTDFKEKDTRVLWAVIGELSEIMARRELIPPSERTGLFKETDEVLYETFMAIVSEVDNRR